MIYIAIYIAEVRCPWVRSLKEKRSLIKPVTEKLKLRFPVSVARLDGLNEHSWEQLGVTAISSDAIWLEDLLNRIEAFIQSQGDFELKTLNKTVDVWELE